MAHLFSAQGSRMANEKVVNPEPTTAKRRQQTAINECIGDEFRISYRDRPNTRSGLKVELGGLRNERSERRKMLPQICIKSVRAFAKKRRDGRRRLRQQ